MSYLELLLLSLGLCFDTFAVSLTGGICTRSKLSLKQILKIIFSFGFFQGGFIFAGWFIGIFFSEYISRFDHWIAFVLLGYIGIKMIIEGFSPETECCGGCSESKHSLLNTKNLIFLSIATSIDAIAVGVSVALLQLAAYKVVFAVSMTFVFSVLGSLLGLIGGRSFAAKVGKRSEIIGGIILILIGVKILFEHLSL